MRPIQAFFQLQAASGIVLLLNAVLALVWANSAYAESYFNLWEQKITFDFGILTLSKTLSHWINDGLMAIFFFVVGLEIKRELLIGELSDIKRAMLAVVGAVGGMVVPAAIYAYWNAGLPSLRGWGIPMATDIAFAIGVITILGSRAPLALKVFITAVAIVDDLGAVLVIAIFYTADLATQPLIVAAVAMGVLTLFNRMNVRSPWPYILVGVVLWIAVLKSGVHATVAGVLLAFTIPANRTMDAPSFLEKARRYLAEFAEDLKPGQSAPTEDQRDAVHALEKAAEGLQAPLARLEHGLHPWVAYFIMPVFALANAGVSFQGGDGGLFDSPITVGIIAGLLFGKQIGILLFAWITMKMGITAMPDGVNWRQMWGVSLLAG
ncbi:MAG: Na+/H+ antiporter NhaA, partial [Bryobacterales bacterium]|nr:Na+/H+ antiporter NhaA [Bryobacterales bacterium]